MSRFAQSMCVAFFVIGLASTWGVLYAFWLSFETFPIASRVWDMDLDEVYTLPDASLSVIQNGESMLVCLRSVSGSDGVALVGDRSSFNECTLLDTLVYLHGCRGGLCLAFQTKAETYAFLVSIGFKDLAMDGEAEDSDTESGRVSPTFEDSDSDFSDLFRSGSGAHTEDYRLDTQDADDPLKLD